MNSEQLEKLLDELRTLANNAMNNTESYTGEADYDIGYESGAYGVGDNLESLMERFDVWNNKFVCPECEHIEDEQYHCTMCDSSQALTRAEAIDAKLVIRDLKPVKK